MFIRSFNCHSSKLTTASVSYLKIKSFISERVPFRISKCPYKEQQTVVKVLLVKIVHNSPESPKTNTFTLSREAIF